MDSLENSGHVAHPKSEQREGPEEVLGNETDQIRCCTNMNMYQQIPLMIDNYDALVNFFF